MKDIKTQVEATLVNVAHNGKYTDSGQEVMDAGVIESATTQILSLINEARVEELEELYRAMHGEDSVANLHRYTLKESIEARLTELKRSE